MSAEGIIRQIGPGDAAIYREIRRNALKDVPQFVGPLAEQEALSELTELEKRIGQYEAEGIYAFGCFMGDECAGVAAMTRSLNPKYAHKVFFWGLYILPAYRGRSVGQRLMAHRILLARNMPGVRIAILQVTTINQPARKLHQRFGFTTCGIEPQALQLDGTFYDFEVMQLKL